MSCTAPIQGHRTASAAANCPECRYRSSYSRSTYYSPPPAPRYSSGGATSSAGGKRVRSVGGRSVSISPVELRTLASVRQAVERQAVKFPDRRDLFLCHAWDDRQEAAKELHDSLIALGVSVWFSENDVPLGTSLIREIDKGLSNSRIGIVLVTPAMFRSLAAAGVADKELSALLATDRVIPVVHDTTYNDLRDVSPLLAARSGLSTEDSSLADVAAKIADTVQVAAGV